MILTELTPLLLGLVAVLLAQTSSGIDSSVVSLIGNGVTVVVLAWYVIYDVRTRTPSMLAEFQKELADSREEHSQTIESLRSAFLSEQAELRKTFATEQAEARAHYRNETTGLRKMLWENMQAMRSAVHDVRETAQGLMTNKDLKDKQE